jgi:hypothetical protein
LRIGQQKLRLAEIHIGETDVQTGFQFASGQRVHLIGDRLPVGDGLLGDNEHVLRAERRIISHVDLQKNIGTCRLRCILESFGSLARARGKRRCPAEIGQQLGSRQTARQPVIDRRTV